MKIILLILTLGLSLAVFAELKVTQVKGNRVLGQFDDQELQANGFYEMIGEDMEVAAKVKVLKTQKQKSLMQLMSGRLEVGKSYTVQRADSQNQDSESKADVFTSQNQEPQVYSDLKKSFSVQGFYQTGTGEVKLANGFVGTAGEGDLSGFSLAADFSYWLSDFALGADVRLSSSTLKGSGGSTDVTSNEVGVFAAYLFPDLKIKLYAGLYFYGSLELKDSSGSSSLTAGETSGFRVGAQYFIAPQFSIIGDYRILSSKVEGSAAIVAKSIDQNAFNVGAGFHF